jgi:hypothetical protein
MFDRNGLQEDGQRPGRPLAGLPRAAQLDALRAQMAAIPGRVGAATTPPVPAADVLEIPGGLGEALPDGGLPRGSVLGCTGGGAVLLGLLAAATAAGETAAVLGNPRIGLLAFHEMGGNLARLAYRTQETTRCRSSRFLWGSEDLAAIRKESFCSSAAFMVTITDSDMCRGWVRCAIR